MEGPVGLEPTTPCLKGRCSNRLSYGPSFDVILLVYEENNSLYYLDFREKVNLGPTFHKHRAPPGRFCEM